MRERVVVSAVVGLLAVSIVVGLVQAFWGAREAGRLAFEGGRPGVAVVNLFGTISGPNADTLFGAAGGEDRVVDALNWAADQERVKAIVLRVNSPGGSVGMTQELHDAVSNLKQADKKVVVSVTEVCASGGYYAACPADLIVSNPGALVGSIGVMYRGPNLRGLLEDKLGVKFNVITSGKWKDMGSPFRDMRPEEREQLQKEIDQVHRQFLDAVIQGRVGAGTAYLKKTKGLSDADARARAIEILTSCGEGQVFTGSDAVERLLVDEIGSYHHALNAARGLAGLPRDAPIIRRPRRNIEMVLDALDINSRSSISSEIQKLQQTGLLEYLYIPGL